MNNAIFREEVVTECQYIKDTDSFVVNGKIIEGKLLTNSERSILMTESGHWNLIIDTNKIEVKNNEELI
jgi:hypothetical protein